ncbi:phage tail protein [Serratia nevei]|uniref:phage tail protein n=1 Tax=Serratia nevei TaxID=2703794 RepID=UPI0030189A5C
MSKYKAIITIAGAATIAAASAGGTQLKIVRMAVGDGNGTLPTPNPAQTKLVNEKYRAALNGLTIDKNLKNHILAEMIIPANVGGFWLREMGLYDEAGTLIAVSNMAESYKPKLEEGSGRTQTLRMILIVSSTEAVQVIAGGDTVLATKDFVADAIAAHEKTRNHPDASTTAKGLVQLSSATNSLDETKAATPKAVKDVNDASAKKAANLSDLPDKAAARGNLALGTAATRNVGVESGQLMAVGALGLGGGGMEYAFTNDADLMSALKKRGSHFFRNIKGGTVIPAWSVGLYSRAGDANSMIAVNPFTGNVVAAGFTDANATAPRMNVLYGSANKPTAADVGALTDAQALQKYALRSIKVNGKSLSGDVNLLAGDVNAWSKTEADGRFVKRAGDTMTGALTLPRVVFPSDGLQASNADSDLTRSDGFALEQLGDKSVGYPLKKGNLGNLMTFKLNKYRHVQFAIGSGNTEFWLRSLREDNSDTSKKWAQVYTTDAKPTIGDVGAADQSNNFAARMGSSRVLAGNDAPTSPGVWSAENSSWAARPWGSVLCTTNGSDLSAAPGNGKFQHYLQLSHEAGGKPGLRAAVNVNGTFSGWDSVMMSRGGAFTGVVKTNAEIQSTSADNYRLIGGGFGSFWRNDGNRLYLLLTNENDQYGTFNEKRPFSVDVRTGVASFESGIHIGGNWPAITTSSGTTWHPDGNVQGSAWGGYLSEWLNNNINGRVDWSAFANRTHEGSGWWRDENTGILLQYGRTYTKGINESANLWQSFNIPFTQWVGPILMTPAWPDRSTWDQYYDYGVQLGSHNTQGFNWNKQCYSNEVRTDWDSGMTWFAIGK